MMLSGEPITASRALQLGLVNRIVDAGDLEIETLKLARQIGVHSKAVIGRTPPCAW